nr:hypothetical protein [Nonlabens ulvanivorans]
MKTKLTLFFLFLLHTFWCTAQEEIAVETLDHNIEFVEMISTVSPVAVNPYLAVFGTALLSKMGFHNKYIHNHPFYDNWFIVILFGLLFSFTAIIGTFVKTNQVTGVIGNAEDFLETKASVLINLIVVVLPTFLNQDPVMEQTVVQAGFITITFKVALLLVITTYFIVVISTVRYFIDLLVFLSPFPLVDSILNLVKIAFTFGLVLLSVFYPTAGFVVTIIIFLVSLLLYRRARRTIQRFKYLVLYPLYNMWRHKEKILTNGEELSILVYNKTKYNKMKAGRIVRLEKEGERLFISRRRYFFFPHKVELDLTGAFIKRGILFSSIINTDQSVSLLLNRSYKNHYVEIAAQLNIQYEEPENAEAANSTSFWKRLKTFFNKKSLKELKTA